MELSRDVHHRPIIFIRFNPDAYTDQEITDALLRIAQKGRPVTANVLRIELKGMEPFSGTQTNLERKRQQQADTIARFAALDRQGELES
jgi:hypothetical protein